MSDLGASELTDDQLVDLLQEACAELAQRNYVVRNAAQQVILDEAEKMKIMQKAINKVRKQFAGEIRSQIQKEIAQEVKLGNVRIMTPAEEARLIAKYTNEALNELKYPEEQKIRAETLNKVRRDVIAGKIPSLFTQAGLTHSWRTPRRHR